jgi:hypothetical protein
VRRFVGFWWDFVVGDDWRVAAGIAVALAAVALLHRENVAAWWLLPIAVFALLYLSLRRGTRAQ